MSVALDGDTAVLGSLFDDDDGTNSGSAYVFFRTGIEWAQQQKLTASDAASGDLFGISVAVDGNTVLVGAEGNDDAGSASGSAYAFLRTDSTWAEQAKIVPGDAAASDAFGSAVALSGDTALFGVKKDAPNGSAYVFLRTGVAWNQEQKLVTGDADSKEFGVSVAIDGNNAMVGARGDQHAGVNTGSAFPFTRSGAIWTEQPKLTASDAALGDLFGASVGISGDDAIVGAWGNDDVGSSSGSAYLFGAPAADLSMVKTGPANVDTSASFVYTLTITNNGPNDATSLTITDTLPGTVVFDFASAGCSEGGGTVTCTTGSLASGDSVVFIINVTAPGASGNVSNTASVSAAGPTDLNSANDSDTFVVAVDPPPADLSIANTASPLEARTGQTLTYTITVTNNGPSTANTVTMTDTLPGTVVFDFASTGCNESGGVVTCTTASMANGATAVHTITVTAPNATGTISNTATVSAASPADPTSSNDSVTLMTTVLGFPPVPAVGAWALGALAVALGAFVFMARRRRVAG